MRFFNHKIGEKNYLAERMLSGANELMIPACVIFYGTITIEQILSKDNNNQQARDFIQCGYYENQDNSIIIVIHDGNCWFVKPINPAFEHSSIIENSKNNDLWKILPVKILKKIPTGEIPPILAGINSNAFLGRGTFREITQIGNVYAICVILGIPFPKKEMNETYSQILFECLSSVELETLVAKLFEENGCFVPAYRGGTIKDIDLFIHNHSNDLINMGGLILPPKSKKSIQVKGQGKLKTCPKAVDYLITFDVPNSVNCFNNLWLMQQIIKAPKTHAWLLESLDWLGKEFLCNTNNILQSQKT